MNQSERGQNTTWTGLQLESEGTRFVAFPVVKLDGHQENIIISATDFDLAYTDTDGQRAMGIMPTQGIYLLKRKTPSPDSPSKGESKDE